MNRRRFLMAIFALAATAAGALESDQVLISYQLTMGTRQINGVSHELEWSFQAIDDDRAQVGVRVPIASFDSVKGPSATARPCLPETTFPSSSKGWPPRHFPSCFNRSNHAIQSETTF